jgi:hypothetical protein
LSGSDTHRCRRAAAGAAESAIRGRGTFAVERRWTHDPCGTIRNAARSHVAAAMWVCRGHPPAAEEQDMADDTERTDDALQQEREMREHEREAREREPAERAEGAADGDESALRDPSRPAPPGTAPHGGAPSG